ncbi:hypothetical protein [Atopobium sp. oral taxon 416]|uniref:hypothetical protein n=1 Tax=Atopobium sp. oral taxon 416 TaxID=712157 RepID=UPI001BA4601D|nr:hypothetical protein [Atopobium sp. oral taxon 416]QUC04369.1 hypothetical protein J4859_05410 [Atopobium sp. oral taxon 416]
MVVTGARMGGCGIVVFARPYSKEALRCPVCGRRCACHVHIEPRRWRVMDLGRAKCWIEYRPARMNCSEHGVHANGIEVHVRLRVDERSCPD